MSTGIHLLSLPTYSPWSAVWVFPWIPCMILWACAWSRFSDSGIKLLIFSLCIWLCKQTVSHMTQENDLWFKALHGTTGRLASPQTDWTWTFTLPATCHKFGPPRSPGKTLVPSHIYPSLSPTYTPIGFSLRYSWGQNLLCLLNDLSNFWTQKKNSYFIRPCNKSYIPLKRIWGRGKTFF